MERRLLENAGALIAADPERKGGTEEKETFGSAQMEGEPIAGSVRAAPTRIGIER